MNDNDGHFLKVEVRGVGQEKATGEYFQREQFKWKVVAHCPFYFLLLENFSAMTKSLPLSI